MDKVTPSYSRGNERDNLDKQEHENRMEGVIMVDDEASLEDETLPAVMLELLRNEMKV